MLDSGLGREILARQQKGAIREMLANVYYATKLLKNVSFGHPEFSVLF